MKAQITGSEFAKSLPASPEAAVTSPNGNSQGTNNSYTVLSDPKDMLSDQLSPQKLSDSKALEETKEPL